MDWVQPDVEAALCRFLAEHPALVLLHAGRAGTDLSGTYPALRVAFVAGSREQPWEWLCRLQIEAWGTSRADASDLARTTVAALDDIVGTHPEGEIRGWDSGLPYWAPGPQSEGGRPRFVFDIELAVFPLDVTV